MEIAKSDVDAYIASLTSAANVEGDMGMEQVTALFAADNEAVEVETEAELPEDAEVAKLLAAADPAVPEEEQIDLDVVRHNIHAHAMRHAHYYAACVSRKFPGSPWVIYSALGTHVLLPTARRQTP